MTRLLASIASVLLTVGCARDVTGEIEAISDRACACKKELGCLRAALADLVALGKRGDIVRGDEARAGAAAQKLASCALAGGMARSELEAAIRDLR